MRQLIIPYYRNTFRFLFTVPDYAQEGLVEYAYQMEGLDRTWYDTEGEQQITFRNIDPGKYIFRVKARLKNGEWDEKNTASIHIVINPPIWATWYAKSLYTSSNPQPIGFSGILLAKRQNSFYCTLNSATL